MDNFEYLLKTKKLYELAESIFQNDKKKRNITDVAISKIPYVLYPELNLNEDLIIHEFAEFLLKQSQTNNKNNEIAITYDLSNKLEIKDGFSEIMNNCGICYGNENEIELFADTKTMSVICRAEDIAVVNIHNHPSCSTFSVQDISFFLSETAVKLMVVVGNNGELYYMSKNSEKYNFKDAIKYFGSIVEKVHPNAPDTYKWTVDEMRSVSDAFLKNCNQIGIQYKHVLGNNVKLKQQRKENDYER